MKRDTGQSAERSAKALAPHSASRVNSCIVAAGDDALSWVSQWQLGSWRITVVVTRHCSWLMTSAATHNGLTDPLMACKAAVPEPDLLTD